MLSDPAYRPISGEVISPTTRNTNVPSSASSLVMVISAVNVIQLTSTIQLWVPIVISVPDMGQLFIIN